MGTTWFGKIFKGELGWKTVTAAGVLLLLVVLRATDVITAEQFENLSKMAEALGLLGIRAALANVKQPPTT